MSDCFQSLVPAVRFCFVVFALAWSGGEKNGTRDPCALAGGTGVHLGMLERWLMFWALAGGERGELVSLGL